MHFVRYAAAHVIDHVVHHFVQAHGHGLGQRTDFRETVGDELQPLHILVHFGNQRVVGITFAQHFRPCHQTRNRRSELVGGFLRQSNPNFVLLSAFRGQQGENRDDHEQQNHAQLHVGIDRQAFQHQRVVVADVDVVRTSLVVNVDADAPSCGLHSLTDFGNHLKAVGRGEFLRVDIAKHLHFAVSVHHHNGNRRVVLDDFQHQIHTRIFIVCTQCTHCLGPDFHFFMFLFVEVARQDIRHNKRCHSD